MTRRPMPEGASIIMSITFRKRPDHTLSVPPEAKEPHLDLHSIDARLDETSDDDDIPVLLPQTPQSAHEAGRQTARSMPAPRQEPVSSAGPQAAASPPASRMPASPMPASPMPASPVGQRDRDTAVHIPPPPVVTRSQPGGQNKPAWQDEDDDMPVLMPAQRPAQVPSFDPRVSSRLAPQPPFGNQVPDANPPPRQYGAQPAFGSPQQAGISPTRPEPAPSSSDRTSSLPAATSLAGAADTASLPGHPTAEDYAPFLNRARGTHGHHSKPELYVWSDDENDAFAQAAQADFTLNRIEPTAGRPMFDASLFRAPSRADALAGTVTPVTSSCPDQSSQMQAEIDALVTELLDESHEYLKRRFLEEIPEIIAKYRHSN